MKRVCTNPWYLPSDCDSARAFFSDHGDLQGGFRELVRLAQLGSAGARAALSLALLNDAAGDRPDKVEIAKRYCTPAASAGDAYAQYVMGWIAFAETKSLIKAATWWVTSSKKNFAPAFIEMGRALGGYWGAAVRYSDAQFAFQHARKLGHRYGRLLELALLLRGGPLQRCLGIALLPWALACLVTIALSNPYSVNVCIHNPNRRGPFFRDQMLAAAALSESLLAAQSVQTELD